MLKTIILTLITFPCIIIFFYILGLLQFDKEKKLKVFSYGLLVFFIFSIPATSFFLSIPLKKGGGKLDDATKGSVTTVVALTGGIKKNILNEYVPSMTSTERVLLAHKLSLDIDKPLIISGGRTIEGAPSESSVTSEYLSLGNITLEKESLNTYQSSLNIKKICSNKNTLILLITDQWHSLRSYLTFKSQKCNVITYNYPLNFKLTQFIPTIHGFTDTNKLIYEYGAIVYYIISSKIKLFS
tara:strand:+ start:809 stop:1531 length:723 start_codon:yes stop_codon:yes gene_type:complete